MVSEDGSDISQVPPPTAPCLSQVSSGNSSCNDEADGKVGRPLALTQLASHRLNEASYPRSLLTPKACTVLAAFHSSAP